MFLPLAVALVVLPLCYETAGNLEHPRRCIDKYKEVLANYGAEKGTCTRLQVFIDCLSKYRDERGDLLDSMRYFFTEQAIFVSKLNICRDIDYKDISDITIKTDTDKLHSYMNSTIVKSAEEAECARAVHGKCVKEYVKMFSKEKKICKEVSEWINCHRSEAEKRGCDAEIIKKFSEMLEKEGLYVIREIRRHLGWECERMNEDL